MPSLYIPSLFDQRKRQYGGQIRKVRQELAEFLDAFEAQVGTEAASVVRAYAAIPRRYFLNSDVGHAEEQDAFSKVRRLATREARLLMKLRSTDCFYEEPRRRPYVFWCYGISWEDVRGMLSEHGRLPLEHVLRLLDVLRNGKPSAEAVGWGRVFRRRRQKLVRLLRTAVSLEEEVVCRFPSRTTLDLTRGLNGQPDTEEETQ